VAAEQRDGIPPDGGRHVAQPDAPPVEQVEVERIAMLGDNRGKA
jgi:hypothetical protein